MYNMAGKSALIFSCSTGLFLTILVSCGFSQVVLDGLVYTELEKTLVQGINGILTCRFHKDPLAVYWTKGLTSDDASLMIMWYEGTVSGPRYDDGSCDIDVNSYSLIINNVSKADTGRFYCVVSNYQGILIRNHTDVYVVDTALVTKPYITLQMRPKLPGILQCTVYIRPRTVTWIKKATMSSLNETLITLESNGSSISRSGAGYDRGICNITQDYSLIINDVQVQNEGLYVCEVTDFDTGFHFYDQTLVNVIAVPLEPFPTILECLHDSSDPSYCTLLTESQTSLTCLVNEYYPDIHLHFLYGSKNVDMVEMGEWNNIDGTKNKTITISTIGTKELYFCVASNIPGTPDNKSASILLIDKEPFQAAILVTILSLLAVFTLISAVACFVWRKRHPKQEQTEKTMLPLQHVPPVVRKREDLQMDVDEVLKQHSRAIYDLIDSQRSLQHIQAEEIVNVSNILDIKQMVDDWEQNRNGGPIQHVLKTRDTTDYTWPSDNELESISRHLPQNSMKKICKKLDIDFTALNGNDERQKIDCLRKWRNNVAKMSLTNKHEQLASVLDSNNLKGLLPPLKGRFIYKAEIVDMAFHLLMHDLLPVAEEWGIHSTRLVLYRPAFQPLHLKIGTIDLLSMLLKTITSDKLEILEKADKRSFFCNKIGKLQNRYVATKGMIAYDMSYGELFSIAEMTPKLKENANVARGQGHSSQSSAQSEGNTSGKASPPGIPSKSEDKSGEDPDLEKSESDPLMEQPIQSSKVELPEDLVGLQTVLQLTYQDISDGHASKDPISAYTLFKMWKEKPRPSVFNYRASLAHALRNMKMSRLADEVLAGNYINELTSLAFIENMVGGMDEDQLESLLKLTGEYRRYQNTNDVISKRVYDWVADWAREMKGSQYFHRVSKAIKRVRDDISEVTPVGTTPKRHKELNDKLVEQGFLDLAREIMIIEQHLAYVEPKSVVKDVIAKVKPKGQDISN